MERTYWSGVSLYSLTTCSKEVTVGDDGTDGFRLAPVGIATAFCHVEVPRFQNGAEGAKARGPQHLILA